MTNEIFNLFSEFNIKLDSNKIRKLNHVVLQFELRDMNPMTLNGQLIGVYPIVFTSTDRTSLFDIFHVNENQLMYKLKNIKIEKHGKILDLNKVNVISDSFNLLCVWLIHLGLTTINNKKERELFTFNVAKYLHYRYFTSLIQHNFRYGADEEVMMAVINDLSKKFNIIINETWKNDIEYTCNVLLDQKSKHYNTFIYPTDDDAFTYIISDTQTSIRSKIGNVRNIYYEYHAQGKKIVTKSPFGTNRDGERFIIEQVSSFDHMLTSVITDLTNVNSFIESQTLNRVSSRFNNLNTDMLRRMLQYMVDKAILQMSSNEFDSIVTDKKNIKTYIGMRVLISSLITTSIRLILLNNIKLKDHAKIWITLKNLYSSSRTNNTDIAEIKDSIMLLIDDSGISNRESTKSSLRLAIIMYVIYKCLNSI